MAGTSRIRDSSSASERGNMGVTMAPKGGRRDNGHTDSSLDHDREIAARYGIEL
jgi:hypothetical protein